MIIGDVMNIIRKYVIEKGLATQWPHGEVFARMKIGHPETVVQPRNSTDACNFVMSQCVRDLRALIFLDKLVIHYYVRSYLAKKRFHHCVFMLEAVPTGSNVELAVQSTCPCRGW